MSFLRDWMGVSAVIVASVSAASAQTPPAQTLPYSPPARSPIPVPVDAAQLDQLRTDYLTGNWTTFSTTARAIATGVAHATAIFDLSKDYVILVWSQQVPTADSPALLAALVHEGTTDPFAFVLPGVSGTSGAKLVEVFVTDHPAPVVESYYSSKPVADPLIGQVPDVAGKVVSPLFALLGAAAPVTSRRLRLGSELEQPPPPPPPPPPPAPPLFAVVRRVQLPEPRAAVTMKMTVTLPITAEAFAIQLDVEENALVGRGVLKDGQRLALTESLTDAAREAACTSPAPAADAALKVPPTCRDALELAVTQLGSEFHDALSPLRTFIEGLKPDVVTGTFTIDDTPLTKLSFGALTSYAPWIFGKDQPVQVEKNQISADPLSRTLQMVVVNVSPWGYQSETTRRWTGRAFFKPFVGAVFAPTIGVAAGASFAVINNIGVNVGYAWVFITQARPGLALGDDLSSKTSAGDFVFSDDLRRDPVERGLARAVFFGVSYSFK